MEIKNNNLIWFLLFCCLTCIGCRERQVEPVVPDAPVRFIPKAEDLYALMKRADSGDGSAEYDIALYEMFGRSDIERAEYWFKRASLHGETRADEFLQSMKKRK